MSDIEFQQIMQQLNQFVVEPLTKGMDELKEDVKGFHKRLQKMEIQQAEIRTSFKLNKLLLGLFSVQFIIMLIKVVKAY